METNPSLPSTCPTRPSLKRSPMPPSAFPQHRFFSSVSAPASPSVSFETAASPVLSLSSHDPSIALASSPQFAASLSPIMGSPLTTPNHTPSQSEHGCDPRPSRAEGYCSIPTPTPPPSCLIHRSHSTNSSPPSNSVHERCHHVPPPPVFSKPLPAIPAVAHPRADSAHIRDRHHGALPRRVRPVFHIGPDVPEKEAYDVVSLGDQVSSAPRLSSKEASKRCHVLLELLSTELGYLIDLRILVSVYLRSLPVLTTHTHGSSLAHFSRTPSMLGINSNQRAQHTKPLSTSPSADAHPPKDKDKRHLFSPADLDVVTRNAVQILELHEHLVQDLRAAVSQFGFSIQSDAHDMLGSWSHAANLQRAIDAVSTIFVDHASSFDCYQSFCTGHPEALELVRKVQQVYPSEWEAFEQRCADITADLLMPPHQHNHFSPPVASDVPLMPSRKRRHSLSSLDPSAATWSLPHVLSGVSNSSASEIGHGESGAGKRRPRLVFVDYLIKPVQRVCRYPLLFDHFQSSSASGNGVTDHAIRVMRAVANSVDEARGRQELSIKSNLIVSRICQGISVSVANSTRSYYRPLTPGFLLSLGPCLTAGSLDVIHYDRSSFGKSSTVTAKYLGAFLFTGGFLILAKVAKAKVYEPRHWFSLRQFELVDSTTDDALLQSWFRLSFKGHTLELAASCRREKDVWMEAIRDAKFEEPTWEGEPPTSLQPDIRTDFILEDVPVELISPLPTIQSIPELDSDGEFSSTGEIPVTSSLTEMSHTRRVNHYTSKVDLSSRRSSLTSLRLYPTQSPETFHLVRSNAAAREQVDRGLQDVLSDKCSSARQKASTLEEDLFEAQNVTRSFSRSSSGLTMASAMSVAAKNKLTKRESVLVSRRKSFLDSGSSLPSDMEGTLHPLVKPAGKRRQLKIVSITKSASSDCDDDGNEPFLESPSPMSHCSSGSATVPITPLNLPVALGASLSMVDDGVTRPEFLGLRQESCAPKRSRSMIDNVRGLFVPRCGSPTSGLVRESSVRSGSSSSSLLRWWSKESIRKRSRSAPDAPPNELPTTQSLGSVPQCPSILLADKPYSQPDFQCLRSLTPPRHTRHSSIEFELGSECPKKARGFFSARSKRSVVSIPPGTGLGSRDREWARDIDVGAVPTRVRRNGSLLQRLTPLGTSAAS